MSGQAGGPGPHEGETLSGGPGPRQERGDARSSRRNPPHTDVNAQGAPAQASTQAPDDVPTLPANAHGRDQQNPHQGTPIDDESMYDGRPGEDKDRKETEMP